MSKNITLEMQQAVKRICKSGAGEPDISLATLVFAFIWSNCKFEALTTEEVIEYLAEPSLTKGTYNNRLLNKLLGGLPLEAVEQVKSVIDYKSSQVNFNIFNEFDSIEHKYEGSIELFEDALSAVIYSHQSYIRRQPTTDFVRNFIWLLLGIKEGDTVTDLGGVLTDLFQNPDIGTINLQYLKPINWLERTLTFLNSSYYALNGSVEEIDILEWEKSRFDIVLANPIFEGSVKGTPYEMLVRNSSFKHYKLLTLFIETIAESLSKTGRAAIVVPEGFLDSIADSLLREKLILNYNLRAVIQLPEGSLSPDKKVAGCILYFDKRSRTGAIRLVDLRSNLIVDEELYNVGGAILANAISSENQHFLCDKQYVDLEESNWNLTPNKYLAKLYESPLKSNELLEEILRLEIDLEKCNYDIMVLSEELEGVNL